jgi:hypothetical protein
VENIPKDNALVDAAQREYNVVEVIGTGVFGLAVKVASNRNQKEFAVRISDVNKLGQSENAVRVACALNSLETPAFVRTYGWLVGTGRFPTTKWYSQLGKWGRKLKKSSRTMYMGMEYYAQSLESEKVELMPVEYKTIAFILLHGLYTGRKAFGFEHDDIHVGQVLLKSIRMEVPIAVGNDFTLVPGSRFIPKLIDFEFSKLDNEWEEPSEDSDDLFGSAPAPSTDIPSLRGALIKHMQERESTFLPEFQRYISESDAWQDAEVSDRHDYQSLWRVLTEPFWSDIILQRGVPVGSRIRCHTCHDVATHRLEGSELYFCGEECAERITAKK